MPNAEGRDVDGAVAPENDNPVFGCSLLGGAAEPNVVLAASSTRRPPGEPNLNIALDFDSCVGADGTVFPNENGVLVPAGLAPAFANENPGL